ncbi:hypothetical protein GCM10020331_037500 [Ectobacillus funiculus]
MQQRYDMFMERKSYCRSTDGRTKKTMEVIEHKCSYYQTALAAGTEDIHKENSPIGEPRSWAKTEA